MPKNMFLIIPAAGLGARMKVVDPNVPKEMLVIGNRPAIQYAVEDAYFAGIKKIIIILNRNKEVIRQYFENPVFRSKQFPNLPKAADEIIQNCSFTFLYQAKPAGEADAILLAKSTVAGSDFATFYPDNIYFSRPTALNQLLKVYKFYRKDTVALTKVAISPEGMGNPGQVDLKRYENGKDVYRISRIYRKSEGSLRPRFAEEFRICGISVYGRHFFKYAEKLVGSIKEGEEFTDFPVRELILNERGLLGCRLGGHVFDIGNPAGYNRCLSHARQSFSL